MFQPQDGNCLSEREVKELGKITQPEVREEAGFGPKPTLL